MAQFYYLISSLPMLEPDEAPKLTPEDFSAACADCISPKQAEILKSLSLVPGAGVMPEWEEWETMLRNRLAGRRSKAVENSGRYIREEKDFFSEIEHGVQEVYLKDNPLERENFLDTLRWNRLEDIEAGHEFDFTKLCVYKLKLLLCGKRAARDRVQGEENYDRIVAHIYGADPLSPLQIPEDTDED